MLILASKSSARRTMLQNAGVPFESHAPTFDEAEATSKQLNITPMKRAGELAAGKALSVSSLRPTAFVIGSDQTLECDGTSFSKPKSVEEAREQLRKLKGRSHQLHSAVALANDEKILWSACETATLTMRNFADQFLESYLAAEANEILHCVGAYRIEGLGLQLFEKIEGTYHTILGMPMLPLLQKLRDHGLIAT
jgi:septum formation protein